jgi:acetoin utilization deacetylase AcuC-like enzyme
VKPLGFEVRCAILGGGADEDEAVAKNWFGVIETFGADPLEEEEEEEDEEEDDEEDEEEDDDVAVGA